MQDQFKIQVYSQGNIFQEGLTTKESLRILLSFCEIYSLCVEKSYNKYARGEQLSIHPVLKMNYVKSGSLDSLFFVDFPAAYAMVFQTINSHSWELFKMSFQFIIESIKLFKSSDGRPNVVVKNSPGAIVITAGRDLIVPHDVFDIAKRRQESFRNLSEVINNEKVTSVSMNQVGTGNNIIDTVSVDMRNSMYLKFDPEEEVLDEEDVICSMYKFNKKSKKGTLEIEAGDEVRSFNFEALSGEISDYLEAMKRSKIKAKIKKKIQRNPFGETQIVYIYVLGVEI